ncbi:hypothetical protein SAMN05444920_130103 [Nonomuraea solani]|uniref:Uncharacterized protein n=1 Tax=Nonomuraea solani TaxID=1144553 RepID=A0A1H6EY99_9ACTN|nr:hypothetical protein [Nonomuraea solani]SEH02878.1 hypothetical protein SAMN05444920_130103 [Nonomuraea solani]
MFLAYCDACEERFLLPANHVTSVHNLESGVIAVELTCYEGHRILVLSGKDIDVQGPATV